MDLNEHPGNLGAVGGSLLTILHADWPAYPEEIGPEFALLHLTAFPRGTIFLEVDDTDQCLLLMADVEGSDKKNLFHRNNFHVAAWHADLIKLNEAGHITGVRGASEHSWREASWQRLAAAFGPCAELSYKLEDGIVRKLKVADLRPPEAMEDEDAQFQEFVILPDRKLTVTDAGRGHIHTIIRSRMVNFGDAISPKVGELFSRGFFDTSVREACVQLEDELKRLVGKKTWGEGLIRDAERFLGEKKGLLESFRRTYRQELRSLFRWIRNNYMHNLVDADSVQAEVLLFRIARVRSFVETLKAAAKPSEGSRP